MFPDHRRVCHRSHHDAADDVNGGDAEAASGRPRENVVGPRQDDVSGRHDARRSAP